MQSNVWFDMISTGDDTFIAARVAIGQEGIDGWTGVAELDIMGRIAILLPHGMETHHMNTLPFQELGGKDLIQWLEAKF